MRVGWMTDADLDRQINSGGRVADIYRQLKSLRQHYAPLIAAKYPPIPRRVSGYNLDQLIPGEGTVVSMLHGPWWEAKERGHNPRSQVQLIDARAQRSS